MNLQKWVLSKTENNDHIKKENQKLLTAIINISNAKSRIPLEHSSTCLRMNSTNRRKRDRKIDEENMAIAQRLLVKKGLLSKKEMDECYKFNKKYKKLARRVKTQER